MALPAFTRANLGRFLGTAVSGAAGFAVGRAVGPVLSPPLQELRNQINSLYPAVPLNPGVLAEGVAQGQINHDTAQSMASHSGISGPNFDHLVEIASVGPGTGFAFDLWRRGVINEDGFRRAVRRLGIEAEWIEDLVKIKLELLGPDDLARAIHRGLIPDPGLLQGDLPKREGNVPAYPVYDIDALAEALGHGFNRERLGVLVGLQGLPMGSHEAAQALFRGVLTEDDYLRAIAEGNTRNEWAAAIREQSRQIPTAREFLENALRGYRTLNQALAGAARHGMTEADALMVYQNQGRPMNVRQITQALARGGKFQPEQGEIKDPYDAAIVEGNLKPAYYDLAKSLRYTVPSVFAIRQLAQSGVWNQAKVAERLKWAGWFPADADEVARAWSQPAGATADAHIGKAQTQLWNTTHRSFIAGEITRTQARNALGTAGVVASAITQVLGIWDAEKALIRAQLSAANIKKAFQKGARNNATGRAWTRDEAIAALVALGWATLQANDYLDIP